MRVIAFRVWNSGISAMFDVYGFNERSIQYRRENGELGTFSLAGNSKKKIHLMQFTGLQDKNGNDIYEGDIVRFLNGETTSNESGMECDEFITNGVIYWEYQSAQWDVTERIDVTREDVFNDEFVVIGNKFQNPELL